MNFDRHDVEGVLYISIMLFVIYGYIMNVYSIWNTIDLAITGKFILRVIGVFMFPLGAILGYF